MHEISNSKRKAKCPKCGELSSRHMERTREIIYPAYEGEAKAKVRYSVHYCKCCRKHFTIDMSHILAVPGSKFHLSCRKLALGFVRLGHSFELASRMVKASYNVYVPESTIWDWYQLEMSNEVEMAASEKRGDALAGGVHTSTTS